MPVSSMIRLTAPPGVMASRSSVPLAAAVRLALIRCCRPEESQKPVPVRSAMTTGNAGRGRGGDQLQDVASVGGVDLGGQRDDDRHDKIAHDWD
jgi:hypothetical protein